MKSKRSSLGRLPSRGRYDRETIDEILDNNYLCHVAYVKDGMPYSIPTAYGRDGDYIYLHGSTKSQMLMTVIGQQVCLSVMRVDGIVLARSLFHSSMNYHSVVLYGQAEEVTEPTEKMKGLRVVSGNIWPGRWDEARLPTENELKATAVVRIPISEGAAKIRTGGAKDDKEDYQTDIWAGVIPIHTEYGWPISDDLLKEGIDIAQSVLKRVENKST